MSWQQSTLGEECELYQPQTLAKNELDNSGAYKVYGANGVIGTHSKYNHEDPQLLVTCRGATCGTINISEAKSWINGNAMVVKPRSVNIDLFFLSHYLQHLDMSKAITGAAQPQITRQSLAPIKIQFPPLAQQQRIAAILDKAAEIKAKREQAIAKLDELRKCAFIELLEKHSSQVTNVKLGSVCNFVRGPFGGALKKEIFVEEGYAVYEQQHAIYNQFFDIRYFVDQNKFTELKRFELKTGDLIMSCSGTMGKVAVVPESIKQGIINQALLKLTPSNKLNVNYLKEYMEGALFQNSLENETHGAAIKNVASVAVLKDLTIALPTMQVQNEIVKVIGAIFKMIDENKAALEKDLALSKSLQHQAFTTGFNA